jgi:glycosyltransferase involved in cell wall biosynthesis
VSSTAPIALSVVVPAYNEVGRIDATLAAIGSHLDLRSLSYEIFVAADGDDGTRERVAERARSDPRLQVLGSRERRGKGHGIRAAVLLSRGAVVGFVDADDKTPFSEIDKLLPWLEQGFDVVVGSRTVPGAQLLASRPLHRRLGSLGFALLLRALLDVGGVRDTQCGFKFFRGEVARELFARQRIDGYMFDAEILHLAARSGRRIKEVGVRWRDDGDSRLDLVAGNWRNLRDILRIRFGAAGPTRHA